MFCSQCQSDQIQKLSLVFESGLSHIQTRSTGVGFGMGGVGIGAAKTRGTQVTATAAKAAPPRMRALFWPIVALIIFGLMGMGANAHAWLIAAAVAAVVIFTRAKWNREVYPSLYDTWNRSYLCGRCGSMMIPQMSAPQIVQTPQPAVQTFEQPGVAIQAHQPIVASEPTGT